jgi:hypothetical protein
MENELLRISLLLDKGSDIIEFLYKRTDTDFMWLSPMVHLNPYKYIQSIPNSIDFRDYYLGGWQEMFPVGGGGFELDGAKIGNHGELWGLPWACRVLKDEPDEVRVKLWTHTVRTPFYVEKILALRRNTPILFISERIENLGKVDLGVMWGHHPAFGDSFLDEHCVLSAPAGSMLDDQGRPHSWPVHEGHDLSRILPRNSDKWNMYFLQDLSEGWYALVNRKRKLGFGMTWDKSVFKYLWFWGCYGFKNISPWYGRAYTVAVEPFTSLPHAMDPGSHLTIPAGRTINTELKAVVFEGKGDVERIASDGTVLGS